MQWTSGKNGGFSSAAPSRLPGPIPDGGFSPEHVNVQDQRRDPGSLLNFMTLLTKRYRECPELGWGSFEVLDQPYAEVLAHRCTWDDGSLVAVHNLGSEPRTVPLKLDDCDESVVLADQLCDGTTPLDGSGSAEIVLDGYGYRWLRVARPGDRGVW
jgi:hypothetical protein